MAQQTFNFDLASLTRHVSSLKPKPVRSLFRGLLLAAAIEPRHVTDIDSSGWLLMTLSVEAVARWSGVDVRTIQRARHAAESIGLVDHSAGINTASEWCFNLAAVLPVEAIEWFRDLVENGHLIDAKKQNATPAFCNEMPPQQNATPAFCSRTPPRAGGGVSVLSSYCFKLNIARLAELAESCERHGIAVSGTQWETLNVDPAALQIPACVSALFLLAADSEVVKPDAMNRRRVFVTAVVAQSKDYPWSYFRKLLMSGQHLTTRASAAELAAAEQLQRSADGQNILAEQPAAAATMTAEQAWTKIQMTLRRWSLMHETERIREELGPALHAAARSIGLRKIADANEYTERALRESLAAALAAEQSKEPVHFA